MKATMVLRLLAVAAFAFASSANAQYTGLYVFGDSLSDTGNNAVVLGPAPGGQVVTGNTYIPTFPYASGQYTNGNVWVHTFAAGLGLSAAAAPALAGGGVFAFGGAQTGVTPTPPGFPPSMIAQTGMFFGATGGSAPSGALYVLAGGGNNARAAMEAIGLGADIGNTIAATAASYAADIGFMVDQLQLAGAHDIIVWNTPNLGLAPAIQALGDDASLLATGLTFTMNSALAAELADEGGGVKMFDVFSLMTGVAMFPGAFGLTNVSDACGALASCDGYLFWDGIHPTAAGHLILGNAMLAAVPEPETYALMAAGLLIIALRTRRKRAQVL